MLALAVARHLARHGLLDEAFLAEHASGVDEHLAAAAAAGRSSRAADVCGVPADAIAAFAEEYAELRPSFLRVGWGIERNRNGGSAYRAVLALPVLAGHFGVTGSGVHDEPVGRGAAVDAARRPRRPRAERPNAASST